MVKIIKLEEKFREYDLLCNVFLVTYSDVNYIKKNDIILDNKYDEVHIENYINTELCLLSNEEREKRIDFIYRELESDSNTSAYKYLRKIWRDIKINEIIN